MVSRSVDCLVISASSVCTSIARSSLVGVRYSRGIDARAVGEQQSSATDLRRLLLRFELLPFDAVTDFDAAVTIYRRCRRMGVTPPGMVDCMIASVAWRHGAALLAHDIDLDRVARAVGIDLDDASLRARQ